ncbi:MAG: hypothetical protein BGP12_04270 [Rhodospirillales bacterium 70-18]|nr:MAG: hypothetical protein BGP12_04270 [Rhodospirillales bacterium 70-18]
MSEAGTGEAGEDRVAARSAIEALRAGVPNGAAIRLLGSVEQEIETAFDAGLEAAWRAAAAPGLVIAGGFGAGKSHLLGYLREAALQQGFVVSQVAVSKETPLNLPGVMFAAAMRVAAVQGHADDPVTLALDALQRRAGAVQDMEAWASTPGAEVSQPFAALLHLLSRQMDPALRRGLEAFLAGARPPVSAMRKALGALGARRMFDLATVPPARLAQERARFVPELFRRAGFAGWCVLIDEVELIGRYGPLQRALAYAELARWLGLEGGQRPPGLYAAAAITDDYKDMVINARQDDEKLPARLELKGLPLQAALVGRAIAAIQRARLLHPPGVEELQRHAERLRRCYSDAYGWPAPPAAIGERRANRTMRHHIRGWIMQWDMLRLEGVAPAVEIEEAPSDYSEDDRLTEPVPEDDPGGDAAAPD